MATFDDITVVAAHLKRRATGVTSTVVAVVPIQHNELSIAALGFGVPDGVPRVSAAQLMFGWRRPRGRPFRIWHARRQGEMLVGCFLKYVLRQPWRLVFTAANARRLSPITRFAIRRMDTVIATSDKVAAALDVPATVVAHGVNTDRFRPAADRDAAWNESGMPGKFGIGILGRVRPQKGTDLFVEAMISILPRHPDWTAIVIGRAKPGDVGFRDDLLSRVDNAGLAQRIFFVGEQPAEEIPRWFRRLSIVVAPAREEGFGLTPLEAMSSGTPVVTSRVGAFERIVDDGKTGVLTPTGDVDAFAGAVEGLMDDDAARTAMGRAAREHVLTRFSIAAEARAINAVYDAMWGDGVAQKKRTAPTGSPSGRTPSGQMLV